MGPSSIFLNGRTVVRRFPAGKDFGALALE